MSAPALQAAPDEICVYMTHSGETKQVRSLNQVPNVYRGQAKCGKPATLSSNTALASPEDVHIAGAKRTENMASSIGRIQLRWPRAVEELFGKNPLRAVADAAQTVSRAVKSAPFPAHIRTMDLDWKIVFMDENLPETQIPAFLVSSCHPAWMTPPANIYVIAQRVAEGCGSGARRKTQQVADALLAQVLIHEFGHAVEFQLLEGVPPSDGDRSRAEGYASWFESFASDFSPLIGSGKVRKEQIEMAKRRLKDSSEPWYFDGSAEAYALQSMIFSAVADRRGVRGLMDVYSRMREEQIDFSTAVQKDTGWNKTQQMAEIRRILGE